MSEQIRTSFNFILTKLGCNRRSENNKRSLRRIRLQLNDTLYVEDATNSDINYLEV